jgi:hypothetical protein
MSNCDIDPVSESEKEVFKIKYYSIRVLVTPVENSWFPTIEYSPVLIKIDECKDGDNYTITDYADMKDEWEWERDDRLPPFAYWYSTINNEPQTKDVLTYSDKSYSVGSSIKIKNDLILYTAWGQSPVAPK